jgi:hypothetical protein
MTPKRLRFNGGVKRILILAVLLTASAFVVSATASARVTTMRLTQTRVSYRLLVDNPPTQAASTQPPSSGDVLLVRDKLVRYGGRFGYEPPVGFIVGHTRVTCTVADYPRARCKNAYRLAGGQIIAADKFSFLSRATQPLRIIGGTGRYRGARGAIAVRLVTATVARLRFTLIT